jgi:hypothetical protein
LCKLKPYLLALPHQIPITSVHKFRSIYSTDIFVLATILVSGNIALNRRDKISALWNLQSSGDGRQIKEIQILGDGKC